MFAKTSQATDAAPAGYAVNPEISSTVRSAPVRPKYFRKVGRTEAPGVNFPLAIEPRPRVNGKAALATCRFERPDQEQIEAV